MADQAIDDFLAESEELLDKLNQDLAKLGDGIADGGSSPDLLNGIFRDAHSIKGLAGMFGFNDVSELAHHLENLLDHLRMGKVALSEALLDCLFDTLEGVSGLIRGKADSPDYTQDLTPYLDRIEHLLTGPVTADEGSLNIDQSLLDVLTEYEEHRLQENISQGKTIYLVKVAFSLMTFDTELTDVTEKIKSLGEVISTLPGTENDDPEMLAFRILCGVSVDQQDLTGKLGRDDVAIEVLLGEAGGAAASQPVAEPEPVAPPPKIEPQPKVSEPPSFIEDPMAEPAIDAQPQEEPETVPQQNGESSSAKSFTSTVRVDIGKLDYLMTIVGELALAKGSIAQLCSEVHSAGLPIARELDKAVHALERRLNELQLGVMDVRMVPVRQLFDKMNRIIRRMAQDLGKKVRLEVRGGDTELDKLIVEELADPLMHIIRNALDHGIEAADERLIAGKAETGTVSLIASQRGNHVVIEVHDDGRGIDPDVLRKKGIEKGLISADANLTRQDLFGLLFHPGFSTKEQVSEFSGRGVGMDVVKSNISALSGMIDMSSEVGKGTVMSLTLPITLAIIKALVVRVKEKDYAIPLNSVLETLMLEPGMLQTIEGREVMELRQQTLSLLRIDELFKLDGQEKEGNRFVVVVGFADKRLGIVVDELRGQQDVVIKSLGKALDFVKGIAGAADLGNQKTILVLDVSGLIGEALQREGGVGV
ncbi:two-component system, chemotaxis family, sensor kinase CheA [Malonomonas rubra DSM 5091]|uniref:histidine kinase n=1 Tax=Malonomonas rubra DSM 5091 TaxID=1122189 RepID=A0A1M6DFL1_MALRU|nr:chemotaxis protein CheA [Malonomonas rubra]SHI72124.1 two-component system, chemotaxis family, sensor kinase CheA [Malonomonas rubra DSM 5091]